MMTTVRGTIWALIPSIVLFAIAFAALVRSWQIQVYSSLGPGPGFFPFCLASLLLVLAVLYGYGSWRSMPSAPEGDPAAAIAGDEKPTYWRPVMILLALGLAGAGLEHAGFTPVMFLLVLCVMLVMQERRPLVLLCTSLGISLGVFLVFRDLLGVPLPDAGLNFIPFLGL